MASRKSLAIRREKALADLSAASKKMAVALGVEAFDAAAIRHKRPEIQSVMRLEAIARFMETAAQATAIKRKRTRKDTAK